MIIRIRDIAISRLRDYENNPRNNDLAVEKVKYSIERFGFLFPVIIDANFVIVAGHTRIRACRELGIQSAPCIIADELTDEQINFFRLVDNKTSEYSDWDFEKLKNELAQIDLTLDKNQILLEQFELNIQTFDLEFEHAEIEIPSFNFMKDDKSQSTKKPQVSTTHVENVGMGDIESDTTFDSFDNVSDPTSRSLSSAEDEAQHIVIENGIQQVSDKDTEQQKMNNSPKAIQFRFGNVGFFISQIELNCLNAKYAEYIDSGEMLKCSFVDYLLKGVN